MTKKRHTSERIVTLLRQVEVAVGNGKATPQACKEAAITEQTYYRWRKEYGGLKLGPGETAERARKRKLPPEARRRGSCRWRSTSCGRWPRETPKPRAAAGDSRRGAAPSRRLGAARVSAARSVARHATLSTDASPRRRGADMRRGRAGQSIRPVWPIGG